MPSHELTQYIINLSTQHIKATQNVLTGIIILRHYMTQMSLGIILDMLILYVKHGIRAERSCRIFH